MDTKRVWKQVLNTIRVSMSSANFSTWLSQTFIVSIKILGEGRQLVEIGCPSSYAADALEKRYFGLLQDSINQITSLKNGLTFVVKEASLSEPKNGFNQPLFSSQTPGQPDIQELLRRARVQSGFTFDNFAVSSTNQMAWAAADAVSRNPGKSYNPFFLWGGVGIGKTHLMLAVAHKILSQNDSAKVLYSTGEEFTTELVDAIRNKTTQEFKNRYRKLDLLLFDDIQFLAGKDASQEEFFHTFNILLRGGGQIILTSDRPPSEIQKIEDRLRSRFEAGLIIDISPPDFELRTAIVLIKAKERGIELPMEAAQNIAANIDNPRGIEGFITRILTEISGSGKNVSLEMVTNLLSRANRNKENSVKHILPQDFITAVSDHFNLGKRKLLGSSRARPIAMPRQILMYLLRIELRLTLNEVGNLVGNRDHTTIMYGVEKISKELSTNKTLRNDIFGIKQSIS